MVEDINLRVKEFEKFHYFLMKSAPEGYAPWFFPCEREGKNPSPKAILKIDGDSKGSWHHKSARLTKEQCIQHIKDGWNIGISARKDDPLILGDIDGLKYLNQVPKNTLITISRKRDGRHFFGWDKDGSAKINLPTENGEMRSDNEYVLAPGSYVPFDLTNEKEGSAFEKLSEGAKKDNLLGYYTISEDPITPRELTYNDLPQFFKDKQGENLEAETKILQREEQLKYPKTGKYTDLFNLRVSDIVGSMSKSKRVGHPLHDSETDANFSLSADGSLGHCWRHMVSLNAVQFLCVRTGYSKCEDAGTPHKGRGISKIRGDKKAFEVAYEEAISNGLINEYKKEKNVESKNVTSEVNQELISIMGYEPLELNKKLKEMSKKLGCSIADLKEQIKFLKKDYAKQMSSGDVDIFSRRGQIESFWKEQPFFYDTAKIFWKWDKEKFKWVMCDEVDFLNSIQQVLGIETIDSKARGELEAGFKQIGRKHKPKEIKKRWVQFKDKIYDVKTGEILQATPEYFVTNPIPWKVGKNEETPTIDKFLVEWVEEKYKPTLYEIIAYNISQDKFMQRIISLCGGGSNGKGTFAKLNYRFLGEENCVSSEVKDLSENHFEPAVLYRKLLCVMGEVSYDDLRNTNMLKKLGGEDKISFQFKGKTPFTADNTATCMCLTNSMPITPDKSMGFYRKWLIIDFPNQFKQIKENIINQIPEIEFENLAKKSLRILKELYENPSFTNEGDFDERAKRYEERSNPVMKFIEEHCEEEAGENLSLRDFTNACNEYLKLKHLRIMSANLIGKILRNEGFSVGQRKIDGVTSVVILNLILNKPLEPLKPLNSILEPYKEAIQKIGGNNGFNGKIRDYGQFDFEDHELEDIEKQYEKEAEDIEKT